VTWPQITVHFFWWCWEAKEGMTFDFYTFNDRSRSIFLVKRTVSSKIISLSRSFGKSSYSMSILNGSSATGYLQRGTKFTQLILEYQSNLCIAWKNIILPHLLDHSIAPGMGGLERLLQRFVYGDWRWAYDREGEVPSDLHPDIIFPTEP